MADHVAVLRRLVANTKRCMDTGHSVFDCEQVEKLAALDHAIAAVAEADRLREICYGHGDARGTTWYELHHKLSIGAAKLLDEKIAAVAERDALVARLGEWREAFIVERARYYRIYEGMKVEQARIHAEADVTADDLARVVKENSDEG